MNELERFLDKLQNSSHHTKRMIMWIGVPVIMATIIFVWLAYSDFGYKDESASAPVAAGTSNFEILKNGIKVSVQEFQSFFQNIKEKISQTNSFNVEVPENTATTSLNTSETSTTTVNQ